ncbi:MAG TPA: GNAT family N-acetyltransferase, partial [Waddliaceae bacterium]
TTEEKTKLIANLLQISGIYMKSSKLPIEMTIVEKAMINPWRYPPRFDFQYGDWLRQSFEKGIIEPWPTHEMPDLALIVTQVLLKSHTLWGLEPEQLLAHVPYCDFMKAMLHDVSRLCSDLEADTRNVLLTYSRIWSTLETNEIRSKPAAADWVLNHLPKVYQPVMKRAKSICIGLENEHWDDIEMLIKPCADFIVDKINVQISLINFDDPNKFIKLAEEPLINNNGSLLQDEERFLEGKLAGTSGQQTKKIIVASYNPEWPKIFEREAVKIQEALGSNCLAVHHIGSTSVSGLSAKPVIDMIGVVRNPEMAIQPLKSLGFTYKGEYNIPMRFYFNRSEGIDVNLHVYKEGHPEIELNLLFRDYLRNHPEVRNEYAELKSKLLQEKSSYEKNNSPFTGYNLGKAAFISKVLKAANFNRIRIMKCTHYAEWDAAKRFRQKYFFDPLSITDPYIWTFNHQEHTHLIFYKGMDIVGYAHIQFWPDQRAALRIIVIDEAYRHSGLGNQFLHLCEQWLKMQGIRSLHDEARLDVIKFYQKNGYTEMPFNDPSGTPTSAQDVAMGKIL